MLGQIVKDLESQVEKCVLNLGGSVSSRRYMNVGTVSSEYASERLGWWW